jgi:hypothetical protein
MFPLILSVALAGDVTLPHTFTNGTVADAEQVNANFAALEAAVEVVSPVATQEIRFEPTMDRATIQSMIDDVGKYIPYGTSLVFRFNPGTYVLDGSLTFDGYYGGGFLFVTGNTDEPDANTLHTTQQVTIDVVSASTSGLVFRGNNVSVQVRNFRVLTDSNNPASFREGILFQYTPMYSAVFYCFVQGNGYGGSQASGVKADRGRNVEVRDTYVSNMDRGIYAVFGSRIYSRDNGSTGTLPNWGLSAHSSIVLRHNATQPSGTSGEQVAAVGGQFFDTWVNPNP